VQHRMIVDRFMDATQLNHVSQLDVPSQATLKKLSSQVGRMSIKKVIFILR
jgi:hypothetical protein